MHLPSVKGLIERRILVNFRVQPEVLQRCVPPPFRVDTVNGQGLAGVCLIRLAHERPWFLPSFLGVGSENAAHRIAVRWDTPEGEASGVYVLRRDTNSRLNVLVGGRLFPGKHHHATFTVVENGGTFDIALRSQDGAVDIAVRGSVVPELPKTSVFPDLAAASTFFARGAVGYSATDRPGCHDCIELCSTDWRAEALAVERVASSWFDDPARFPPGSVAFDSALLLRDVPHTWRAHPTLRTDSVPR